MGRWAPWRREERRGFCHGFACRCHSSVWGKGEGEGEGEGRLRVRVRVRVRARVMGR